MRNPVIHPPVAELLRIVQPIKNLHMCAIREVMRQNLVVSLVAYRPDDAIRGTKFLIQDVKLEPAVRNAKERHQR